MSQYDHLDRDSESSFEASIRVLKENADLVATAILLIAGAFIALSVDVEIPRFWKVAGLAGLAVAPWAYVFAGKILSVLHNPNHIYLVDLDARHLDGALYEFPFADFRQIETRTGEMTQLSPNLYTAKDVDLDSYEVTGTWRGTLDDRELLKALEKVYECRGQLQKDAQEGFAIEVSAPVIVRNAVRETTRHVMDTFESGALPDEGAGLQDAIDDQIERFDLEEKIEGVDDPDDEVDPAEAEGDSQEAEEPNAAAKAAAEVTDDD